MRSLVIGTGTIASSASSPNRAVASAIISASGAPKLVARPYFNRCTAWAARPVYRTAAPQPSKGPPGGCRGSSKGAIALRHTGQIDACRIIPQRAHCGG